MRSPFFAADDAADDFPNLLDSCPALIGKVLVFVPSREMKCYYICLREGKVVDIQTSDWFEYATMVDQVFINRLGARTS